MIELDKIAYYRMEIIAIHLNPHTDTAYRSQQNNKALFSRITDTIIKIDI